MSPAKPMQPQNVSNNPLSPHGHLPVNSGPSPQPRQLQQQAAKNASSQQAGSVSTLQALEQMVMPPSVAPGPVMQTTNMDAYASQYRPSAQQMQHSAAVSNPLTPMTSMSTSPQHHQQWPTMNRAAMSNLNHQQTAQMNLMPQQQMPNVSQMSEIGMAPSRAQAQLQPPQSRMMAGMSQNDTSLTQMDHMQMHPPSIATSMDPMNSSSSR